MYTLDKLDDKSFFYQPNMPKKARTLILKINAITPNASRSKDSNGRGCA